MITYIMMYSEHCHVRTSSCVEGESWFNSRRICFCKSSRSAKVGEPAHEGKREGDVIAEDRSRYKSNRQA